MSYIVALYHIVFSTKGREATLDKEHRAELFSFIAGIVKRKGCKPIIVNGGVDHVHILLDLSSTMTLSEVVKEIKRSSTLWIKERKIFPMFSHWESEYGAFSVSKSHRDAVYSYIMNQEQHHSHLNVLDEFNRSSAVDSLIHNHPQVGKPTWCYDYTTVLRWLPHPSKKNAHHHRFAPTAQCGKNRRRAVSYVSTGLACLPRDINASATTAEERL